MARTPHARFDCAAGCPVEATLNLIGGKWKGVILYHLLTGKVLRFPTLIVCCFTMMAAVQSFFAGMMLTNMALTARRNFEFRLNDLHAEKVFQISKGQREER